MNNGEQYGTTVYAMSGWSRDDAFTWRTCEVWNGFGDPAGQTRPDLHQLRESLRLPL